MGGHTVVYTSSGHKQRRKRVLLVRGTQQSAMWADDPWDDLPFPYLQLFDLAFEVTPVPHRLLLIGGGGFSWPRHVLATHSDAALDVVEIDPEMLYIARQWFCLDVAQRRYGQTGEGRLRVFLCDGLSFLGECGTCAYDVIVNDCFIASEPAASLMDDNAAALIRRALVPGGLYLTNVISALTGSGSETLMRVADVLKHHFAQIDVVPCSPEDPLEQGNIVVAASDTRRVFPSSWMTWMGRLCDGISGNLTTPAVAGRADGTTR